MKDDSTAAEAKRLFVIPFIFQGLEIYFKPYYNYYYTKEMHARPLSQNICQNSYKKLTLCFCIKV